MNELLEVFSRDSDFRAVLEGVKAGMKEQMVSGLSGSVRQVMSAAFYHELKRPIVIVTHNMFSAQKIVEDMAELLPKDQVLFLPGNESIAAEAAIASPEISSQRIEALSKIASGFRGVIVTPYASVRKLLPPAQVVAESTTTLAVGQTIEMEQVITRLTSYGYERVDRVESRGQLSVRGGILDVFPLVSASAYRIEWFDDEIDTIRQFDVSDQRSTDKEERIDLLPAREVFAERRRFENAADHAFSLLQEQLGKMNDRQVRDRLTQELGKEIEWLREHMYFQGIYKYISLLYPERATLMDYLPKETLLLMDEPTRLLETVKELEKDEAEWTTSLLSEGQTLPSFVLSKSYESLFFHKPFQVVYMSLFLRQIPHTQPQNIVNFMTRSMQHFHGQMNVLKAEMERWKKAGSKVMILASGQERIERVRRVLQDYQIDEPEINNGSLQAGFELPSIKLIVITENELFTQKNNRKPKKSDKKIANAERIKSYMDLKVGDYVVHVNHGIGKYVGIGTLEVGGIHKDYLHIVYAGGDRLSVPIEQIDMVQKYVGAEDKEPKIYKLGGSEWQRVKSKARSSVQDIADELIKLYAARQATPGFGFGPDTPYQKEFEDNFPYDETADQLRAIEEIKKDMQKSRPMDRLLCGDVGYGKTEVAVRAAFKAAIEGKQVAVLVPTTILAQQHFETFKQRFSGYPFTVGVLSRFRTKKEQNETIKGVKAGTVDVLVGTHRLLSQDVQFKDLGLLIVDEEQRFGVTHKEKLKRLKTNVDVLTLTATPIPRTLHMSMLGVRDLSVIETPPENRFPVQTYVVEYGAALVREAIERELARNGQVYYLYNRVQGIHQMADQIRMLVPEARVAVGHGQMSEQELEKTILDFLDGEFDVLVSTSIIETGVDIPNVNTLIVHDADKMGLSQLYQLRGRVGRSNRIAYAYFTYQRDKVLNEVAEKRLQSIKEFTELGSGFKIAMRDLAIRGAGNLLGAEQHGFIASVGFDLYSQMLTEEINRLKLGIDGADAEVPEREWVTQIDYSVDAYIPSEYIYDSTQKIEIYKKVSMVRSLEEAEDLQDELIDRFGEPPESVVALMRVSRIRVYGMLYKIRSMARKGDEITILMDPSQNEAIEGTKLVKLSQTFEHKVRVIPGPQIHIALSARGMTQEAGLEMLEKFLVKYNEVLKKKGELQNAAP
ncbi:transcription-repair coupling factor [Paenibacillus turpanensis]|uniref:transcription-repair coupling factor n=1 Tax=Paenibacillus turpanensis TaxID=2689078 RepID=UPI00140CCF84|nr:transcription-repair coupling factor [Paenibacillus turpanensis]